MMRYVILLAMLLCLPVRGEAWQVVCASGGCNPAENEIGIRDVGDENSTHAQTTIIVYRFQADCSGLLNTAYRYHNSTSTTDTKIAIYNSTTSSPATDTGMSLVGYSSGISSGGSVGWRSGAFSGGEVIAGNYYWMVLVVSGSLWNGKVDNSTVPFWYRTTGAADFYAEIPALLMQSSWYSESGPIPSAYVSIGN